MSYSDIADISQNSDLMRRVIACARQEGITNPEQWAADHMGDLAAEPGWAAKWASGVAARQYTVGTDPAVVGDDDILSAVQALNQPA